MPCTRRTRGRRKDDLPFLKVFLAMTPISEGNLSGGFVGIVKREKPTLKKMCPEGRNDRERGENKLTYIFFLT